MKTHFILVILSIWTWQIDAQAHNELAIANTLFDKGDYSSAILKYNEIIENGDISAEVYYNLGNTYLRVDSLPASILNYERALRLDPGDNDILNNLEIARGKVEDQVAIIPEFFLISIWKRFCLSLTANSWASMSILLLMILVGLYYLKAYKGLNMRSRYRLAIIGLLTFCLLISLLAGFARKNMDTNKNSGIVFVETFMKSGPDSRSDDLKLMHPGYKVFILDTLNGWIKVRTEDREEGWIEPESIQII